MQDNAQGLHGHFKFCEYREIGTLHIERGKTCEDFTCCGEHPETGVTAVVLSDGAGSCAHAQAGSEVTARAALDYVLAQDFDELYRMSREDFGAGLLGFLHAELMCAADQLGTELMELSSTLLLAVMAPDGRYLWFHVGDGLIAACSAESGCWILSQYFHVIASNFTTFVTVPGTEFDYGRGCGGIDGFLLTSDGPENYLAENGELTSHGSLILETGFLYTPDRMVQELQGVTSLFKRQGMYDDCSFTLLCDRSRALDMYYGMDPAVRRKLFSSLECASGRSADRMILLFDAMRLRPDGMALPELTRLLHMHKDSRTRSKLAPLVENGILMQIGSRYYF